MKPDIDPEHTAENPDLAGFDLEAMKDCGAFRDGSGGGIRALAWEMGTIRELRERCDLLEAFVRKHQLLLACLSWDVEATTVHPTKKEGEDKDLAVFVPQIQLCSYAYNKQTVTAKDIAALWPEAKWRRSMPRWGESETERDYTADVDGVLIRIHPAERLPVIKVDRFERCGPISIN